AVVRRAHPRRGAVPAGRLRALARRRRGGAPMIFNKNNHNNHNNHNYYHNSSALAVVWSWLTTTDHKRIALLYLGTITLFFALGGLIATVMRIELASAPSDVVSPEVY